MHIKIIQSRVTSCSQCSTVHHNKYFKSRNPVIYPFECSRGCGKRFKTVPSKGRHQRDFCPLKLKCPVCNDGFSSQRKLASHMKGCTGPAQPGDRLLDPVGGPVVPPGDVPPAATQLPAASGDQPARKPEKLIGDETDYSVTIDQHIDLPLDPNIHKLLDVASVDDFLDMQIDFSTISN